MSHKLLNNVAENVVAYLADLPRGLFNASLVQQSWWISMQCHLLHIIQILAVREGFNNMKTGHWTRSFMQHLFLLTLSPTTCKLIKEVILAGPTLQIYREIQLQKKVVMVPHLDLCTLHHLLLMLLRMCIGTYIHTSLEVCLKGFQCSIIKKMSFMGVTSITGEAMCMQATNIAFLVNKLYIQRLSVWQRVDLVLPHHQ